MVTGITHSVAASETEVIPTIKRRSFFGSCFILFQSDGLSGGVSPDRRHFLRIYTLILSAQSSIPKVAENESSNPTSPTMKGLGRASANAAMPRELTPSGSRKTALPKRMMNSMMPARITDGVKPVTAANKTIIAVNSTSEIHSLSPIRRNSLRNSSVTKERCIPETTTRYDVPVNVKASFRSLSNACLSPRSTAFDTDAAVLSKAMVSSFLTARRRPTANEYGVTRFSSPTVSSDFSVSVAKRYIPRLNWYGNVDALVAGVGTSGTLSGTARVLRSCNPDLRVVAVEPKSSPMLSQGVSNVHKIPGIGANFVPPFYDKSLVDEVIAIEDEEAFQGAQIAAMMQGLAIGISAGAALKAAILLAKREDMKGKNIVVIFPDAIERYLSMSYFKS